MSRLVLGAILVALTAACGGSDDETERPPPPAPPSEAASAGRLIARPSAAVEDEGDAGLQRLGAAQVYVTRADGPKTLVLGLHGAGSSPDEPMALLRPHADRAGLIVLAPKSKGPTWDIAQGGFGPDVAAIDDLLEQVFSEY